MMRKTSLVLHRRGQLVLRITSSTMQPVRLMVGSSARAAAADTYRQLNLFGDIFERVRAHYVDKPTTAS